MIEGEIYVDYTPDLYQALQKNKESIKPGEDIREILVETIRCLYLLIL